MSRQWSRPKALQTASAWTCLDVWTGPVRPVLPDPYRPRVAATRRLQSEILWIIMIIRPDSEVAYADRPVRCGTSATGGDTANAAHDVVVTRDDSGGAFCVKMAVVGHMFLAK